MASAATVTSPSPACLLLTTVPVVHTHGLGSGSGTDLNVDPTIVDGDITGGDELIAFGDVGQSAGVDVVGIGGYSNLAFAGLLVVLNIPVVDADLLSGRFHLDPDPTTIDGDITGGDEFIAFGDIGQSAGVDVVGIGGVQ